MAETKIQWTHRPRPDGTVMPGYTFNPWRGCEKVAAGCTNCYAARQAKRNPKVLGKWGVDGTRVFASSEYWAQAKKWDAQAASLNEQHLVFCASMADVFEDWEGPMVIPNHEDEGLLICDNCRNIDTQHNSCDTLPSCSNSCGARMRWYTMSDARKRLFELIDKTPNLIWLLLTKRPENISRFWTWPTFANHVGKDRPNVWLGTSIATQSDASRNIPLLLKCRDLSPCLFVSAEPLIEAVDLEAVSVTAAPGFFGSPLQWHHMGKCHEDAGIKFPTLDWLIIGGESGPGARPCNVAWIRSLVRQCKAASIPTFVKQLGSYVLLDGASYIDGCVWKTRHPKGGDPAEWPEDLRVQQFPEVQHA